MSLSENDQEDVFVKHFQQQKKLHKKMQASPTPLYERQSETAARNEFSSSPAVSWPIVLAIIPTLGAFFAGSAEIWSDFIMLLLILYYVYKWLTVPWSYYESARSRRIIHQNSEKAYKANGDDKRMEQEHQRRQLITAELRRHELAGLIWVVLSPAIAGYSLRYSRYLLSNVDRYISGFNVTVFILAASIKPLSHIISLLHERTLFLQSEAAISESQIHVLQTKLDLLEKELFGLRKAFATKKDLGQVVSEDINPTLQHLAKALKRFEKRDVALRTWSEEQFTSLDLKVREFDQYILYRIEQDQRQQAHGMVVSLILLPLNISLWVAKRMTHLLPIQQKGKHLLTTTPSNNTPPTSRHQPKRHRQDPAESSYYSTEGSIAAFGH